MKASHTRKRIAFEEAFLEAWLWQHPSITHDILEVLRTPELEPTDECTEPLHDFLANHCSREIDWSSFEAPEFFFGECVRTEIRIYRKCPGEEVEHNCAKERRGDKWLNIGQSVN